MTNVHKVAASALSILLFCETADALLDVMIKKVNCNETLPVYLTNGLSMNCGGKSRCTFGEPAVFTGMLSYNGLEDSGVINSTTYITSDLDFVSVDYHLFDVIPVDLCDDLIEMDENTNNTCPGDGTYPFVAYYTLPSNEPKTSWLATGWKASGEILMYDDADATNLVGHCTMTIDTFATQGSGKLYRPSAGLTIKIILALAALTLVSCMYCKLRKRKSDGKSDDSTTASSVGAKSYVRMDNGIDTKSDVIRNRV